ncbi:MAG: hypothetical protein AMXMBFR13_06850 [Phycisphaerae bacterium]
MTEPGVFAWIVVNSGAGPLEYVKEILMSDRMSAEIRIGGKVKRSHLPKLCEAIRAEGVSFDWGDAQVDDIAPENITQYVSEDGVLCFCDDQARYGEFEGLEAALVKLGIAFDRESEGKYEYDPEVRHYRPGEIDEVRCTNHEGVPVIYPADVEKALKALKAGKIEKSIQMLEKLCPQAPSPLLQFEIVD